MTRVFLFIATTPVLSFVAPYHVLAQSNNQPKVSVGIANTTLPPVQEVVPIDRPIGNTDSAPPEHRKDKRSGDQNKDLIFAPIPIANEAIGVGIVPMVKYVFSVDPKDRSSQPSSLTAAGFGASSKSWGAGGGGNINFRHDQFRTTLFSGYSSLHYDLFGVGTDAGNQGQSVSIDQIGYGVFAQALVRLWTGFYIGPLFIWTHTNISVDLSQLIPPDTAPVLDDVRQSVTLSSLGFNVQHDRRDSIFYPTHGHFFQATGDYRSSAFGSNRTYQTYMLGYNHYFSLSDNDVLAVRASGCGVVGERIPFYGYCQFGQMGDNRGYQTGRYRDLAMFATQAEYRRIINKRWGGTAYFGVGEVAPDGGSFTFDNLLPSGGLGVRFNLAKNERINLRADFSYSKTGFSWSMGSAKFSNYYGFSTSCLSYFTGPFSRSSGYSALDRYRMSGGTEWDLRLRRWVVVWMVEYLWRT